MAQQAELKTGPIKLSTRGQNTKLRITDAALSEFARRGYDGVSIADVADLVGITQPNIHYYFNTKKDLWRAAIKLLRERASKSARNVANVLLIESMDPLSALKVLSSSLHNVSRDVPELGKIITLEGVSGGERLEWLVETVFHESYDRYRILIERCIEQKLIKPYRPHQVLFLIHSAAVSYYNLAPLINAAFDADPMDEEVSNEFRNLYLDTIFSGLTMKDPGPCLD